MTGDRSIRRLTAAAVLAVAVICTEPSKHAYSIVRACRKAGRTWTRLRAWRRRRRNVAAAVADIENCGYRVSPDTLLRLQAEARAGTVRQNRHDPEEAEDA